MRRVAIDIGQTGIRMQVDGHDPVERASDGAGGGSVATLLGGIADLRRLAGIDEERASVEGTIVAAGITGDYSPADAHLLTRGIREMLGAREARTVHDSATAFLGALGPRPGVVTMCGTGAVTLAFDGRGLRRFDGLGALGDWGGGAALGLSGVRAALRAWDGVGPATSLARDAADAWASPSELYGLWRAGDARARAFVTGFARTVAARAEEGDAVATHLVSTAAGDAAETTRAALRLWAADAEDAARPAVSYGGALLLRVEGFRDAWHRALAASTPSASVLPPEGDGLVGAARLLDLDAPACAAWGVLTATGPAPVSGPRAGD